jgi:thioesterase domain-containing protein
MQTPELERLLKTEIPIAQHLGIRDLYFSENDLVLTLPLRPNVNHKGTMFGGSLYSASALASYALFLSALRNADVNTNNIVIADGNITYLAPVDQDAKIKALWNSIEEKEKFFKALKSKNKARVLIRAEISVGDKTCAKFTGSFVAQLEV